MWEREGQEWSPSFRLLRVDLRGFGNSPLEPGPFAQARDLIEVLEAHGMERAALVGVSLGGRVALEGALARPRPAREGSEERRDAGAEEEAALEPGDLDAGVGASLRTWVDGPRRRPE